MPTIHGHQVRGVEVDDETRCVHWHSPVDVVAIRFPCCETYYPCYECHQAVTDHDPAVWGPDEGDRNAVLCGACGEELSVRTYLDADDVCPTCGHGFNPGCRTHAHLYFDESLRE